MEMFWQSQVKKSKLQKKYCTKKDNAHLNTPTQATIIS